MSITYSVTVTDELNQIKRLHHTLLNSRKPEDEIAAVHLYRDEAEMNDPLHIEIKDYLLDNFDIYCNYKNINDIAHLKNYICDLSSKDYIVLLDANEMVNIQTITLWNQVILNEPEYDIFWTPRINLDDTITEEEKKAKYGIKMNEQGWINWPDNQPRIIKTSAGLIWEQKEQSMIIKGAKKSGALTADPRLATINQKRK